mmetsp:Transcript_38896/g.54025  ORF Transcript_38896/g.54025 Transcript_38896/m.54025 type:complete len:90 (-) Transcript_38896:462-731(-)
MRMDAAAIALTVKEELQVNSSKASTTAFLPMLLYLCMILFIDQLNPPFFHVPCTHVHTSSLSVRSISRLSVIFSARLKHYSFCTVAAWR